MIIHINFPRIIFSRPTSCNYEGFLGIQQQVNDLIDSMGEASSSQQIDNIQFQLDTLKFKENWNGCQNLLNQMLVSHL